MNPQPPPRPPPEPECPRRCRWCITLAKCAQVLKPGEAPQTSPLEKRRKVHAED